MRGLGSSLNKPDLAGTEFKSINVFSASNPRLVLGGPRSKSYPGVQIESQEPKKEELGQQIKAVSSIQLTNPITLASNYLMGQVNSVLDSTRNVANAASSTANGVVMNMLQRSAAQPVTSCEEDQGADDGWLSQISTQNETMTKAFNHVRQISESYENVDKLRVSLLQHALLHYN